MHSRALRILVLLATIGWFAAVLPGHQRGVVPLPGMKAGQSSGCCASGPAKAAEPGACHDGAKTRPADGPSDDSRGDPAAGCAICFLIAHLSPAVTIDLSVPEQGLLGELSPAELRALVISLPHRLPFSGRDPPKAA